MLWNPGKLTLISPAPPQPQCLLTQWDPGICVFQTLLEEFGWASRGQTWSLHQEAKAHLILLHGNIPAMNDKESLHNSYCPCPNLIWPSCARPKSTAVVPTKGQRQYGAAAWGRCQLHPTARMPPLPLSRAEFGRSLNSSKLKCPHLQKGE